MSRPRSAQRWQSQYFGLSSQVARLLPASVILQAAEHRQRPVQEPAPRTARQKV